MPFTWISNPQIVLKNSFKVITREWRRRIFVITEEMAIEVEEWMRTNAVWEDRTGAARATLFAEVEGLLLSSAIAIGHGVPYGFWLEFANQGRFAIIGPALDHFAPRFYSRIQAEISRPA